MPPRSPLSVSASHFLLLPSCFCFSRFLPTILFFVFFFSLFVFLDTGQSEAKNFDSLGIIINYGIWFFLAAWNVPANCVTFLPHFSFHFVPFYIICTLNWLQCPKNVTWDSLGDDNGQLFYSLPSLELYLWLVRSSTSCGLMLNLQIFLGFFVWIKISAKFKSICK